MLMQAGSMIPDGQLCLTFDDGPGPHTAEISSYLRDQEISATFFLIGEFVAARKDVVQQLIEDGHEIGNHTHTHALLTANSVYTEIETAHEELRSFVESRGKPIFFGPPYGNWPTVPDLNSRITQRGERLGDLYGGPVSWDFNGDDWWYWDKANGADDPKALMEATARYDHAHRGIILMHDHSHEVQLANKNQTHRMIKELVPSWKSRGCTFTPLRSAYRKGFLDIAM